MDIDFEEFDADVSIAEKNFPKKAETELPPAREYGHDLGLFQGISNNDYHSGPGISSSALKYAVKCPALYEAYMNKRVSFQESEAMRLGTAVHKLCLEAYDFGNEIAICRKFGHGASDQAEKAEFFSANRDKTIITPDQYDQCRWMTDSLMSLPDVHYIFKDGHPELSGYYIDEGGDETFMDSSHHGTRMLCKYRPDWRTDWCLADVKTTRDITASAFSRTINNLGYHISAAHYLEGDRTLKGSENQQFVFLCVEPEPPYLAAMYVLDDKSLTLGKELRRKALADIKHGRNTGEYALYNGGMTQEIGVPEYAFYESTKNKI